MYVLHIYVRLNIYMYHYLLYEYICTLYVCALICFLQIYRYDCILCRLYEQWK